MLKFRIGYGRVKSDSKIGWSQTKVFSFLQKTFFFLIQRLGQDKLLVVSLWGWVDFFFLESPFKGPRLYGDLNSNSPLVLNSCLLVLLECVKPFAITGSSNPQLLASDLLICSLLWFCFLCFRHVRISLSYLQVRLWTAKIIFYSILSRFSS